MKEINLLFKYTCASNNDFEVKIHQITRITISKILNDTNTLSKKKQKVQNFFLSQILILK